jgi:hypothetical protein
MPVARFGRAILNMTGERVDDADHAHAVVRMARGGRSMRERVGKKISRTSAAFGVFLKSG